jgi:hypothetical protein
MPANRIDALLDAPEIKALSRKAKRLCELQQVFVDSAPASLSRTARVTDCRAGTVFVSADNAAAATKLRQLAPSLLLSIRKRETEVTAIKITVQVREVTDAGAMHARVSPIEGENLQRFRELAESLRDSELKSALTRLVRRHGRR